METEWTKGKLSYSLH